MIISVQNNLWEDKTVISSQITAGDTTIYVKNTVGLSANDYLFLGGVGGEKTEIVQISSITNSTTIVLTGGTVFPHGIDTNVSVTQYNQMQVYKSSSSSEYNTGTIETKHNSKVITGTGTVFLANVSVTDSILINGVFYGVYSVDSDTQITLTEEYKTESISKSSYKAIAFSHLATVDVQANSEHTEYSDANGTSEDYYKTVFYNSTLSKTSSFSDVVKGSGSVDGSIRDLIKSIRFQSRENDITTLSDDDIISLIEECVEDMWSSSKDLWWWERDMTISTVADKQSYDLPDDFSAIISVDNEDTTIDLEGISYREFKGLSSSTNDTATIYSIWGGRIYLYPTPQTTTTDAIHILYYARPAKLNSGSDVTEVIEKRIIVSYVIAKIMMMNKDFNEANVYMREYEKDKKRLIGRDTRDVGQGTAFIYNPSRRYNRLK